MARLQILELPEGSGDDRPPFLLVVDQMPKDEAAFEALRCDLGFATAQQIGARAVLVFEETVDIPANDSSAYLADPHYETSIGGQSVNWTEHDEAQAKVTEALRLGHERTDIARDMDRLATHKAALLDALGMDRTRDWDDIRNAAAGLRKQRDDQAAELERLRAGEEPVTDTAMRPTSGQWIWQWNRAAPEKRLSMAAQILDGMDRSNKCWMENHEARLADLHDEVQRLRREQSSDTERSPEE